MRAQNALQQLATKLASVIPLNINTWEISTRDLKPGSEDPQVITEVRSWAAKNSAFLYYFSVVNNVDLSCVERVHSDAKDKEKNERAYARLIRCSKCFYVGGSQNMSQRLREHLGFGARQTYTLQLAHWAPALDIELQFTCAKYADDVDADVLQALEDDPWVEMGPMFGRKGAR